MEYSLSKINLLSDKISIDDLSKIIPGWFHLNTINDIAPIYICPKMEKDLEVSLEEVQKRGVKFMWEILHPDSISTVIPRLRELIHCNDSEKSVTFFQKILLPHEGYVWFVTNSMVNKTIQCIVSVTNRVDGLIELNEKIKSVLDNDIYMRSNLNKYAKISHREREIVKYLVKGDSMEGIAKKLFISENTVKTHRRNIYKKLNINSIRELIRFAHLYHF